MWLGTYQLGRLAQRGGVNREAIEDLRKRIISSESPQLVPYVGLVTRWAEYFTRKEFDYGQAPQGTEAKATTYEQ